MTLTCFKARAVFTEDCFHLSMGLETRWHLMLKGKEVWTLLPLGLLS